MSQLALALLLGLLTTDCVSLSMAGQQPECAPLELADVVSILGEWSVQHVSLPSVVTPVGITVTYGTTNSERLTVLINADAYPAIRRLAVIHELEHVRLFKAGLDGTKHDDARVRRCAIREYRRLFGGDLDLPEPFREAALEGWR